MCNVTCALPHDSLIDINRTIAVVEIGTMTSTKPCQLKMILIGDSGVGKSSLMNRYINSRYDSSSFTTIGVEFLNKEIITEGKRYTVQIWDTGGQERFRSLRTPFYRGSDCCILTFALDDRASFANLDMWKKEFLHYSDVDGFKDYPFIVLGTKADRPDHTRQVSLEEISSWREANDSICYYETSSKDNTNVNEAFQTAIRLMVSNSKNQIHRKLSSQGVDLSTQEGGWKVSCCNS